MKTSIQAAAAVVTLFASQAAHAQQAAQWRVQDGGNGHWYRGMRTTFELSWLQARDLASSVGGHLATVTSEAEYQRVHVTAGDRTLWNGRVGPWLGGYQDRAAPDYAEPASGWRWVTGEPWFSNWEYGEPSDFLNMEDYLHYIGSDVGSCDPNLASRHWNDFAMLGYDSWCTPTPIGLIIEWSADCNNDSIVDYGQCLDGTLPDFNGNNVPDCCERGEPCAVGNYPLQWHAAEGGNSHWYLALPDGHARDWDHARSLAESVGGYLASVTTAEESEFVWSRLASNPNCWTFQVNHSGPALGGYLEGGIWRWTSGEPWAYTNWGPCFSQGGEQRLHYGCRALSREWNDLFNWDPNIGGAIIEWSADCNADGIVDYGQILQRKLPDANGNGIPDRCECSSSPLLLACCNGNLNLDAVVDGADLGIMLFAWGSASMAPAADINVDGVIDGSDLGLLLAAWGPCPH